MVRKRILGALPVLALMLAILACNFAGAASPAAPGSESTPASSQPTAEPASQPAPQLAGGACSNSLYPVIMGATWTYSLSGVTTDTYTRSITAVKSDGFTDQDVFTSGVTRTGDWKCDNGTLIALSPDSSASATVLTSKTTATFHTTDMSGVTLPASIKSGDTWTQNFSIEGTQSIGGQDVAAKSKVAFACTAGGTESVIVAAGTFDAQRVDCKIDTTITVTMGGLEVPTNLSSDASMWYAPNVGLVKLENAISGVGNSTTELTSYKIP